MKSALSRSEKLPGRKSTATTPEADRWIKAIILEDEYILDEEDLADSDPSHWGPAVRHIGKRILPPPRQATDPADPQLQALMETRTPFVQVSRHILNGMPVFRGTTVPLKRLFDYVLAGKSLDEFSAAFPTVPANMAALALRTPAVLFYEALSKELDCQPAISKAIDSAAMPSSRPR